MLKEEDRVAGKSIIFSAPSGAGKTTIVHELLRNNENFAFSISACSRGPRQGEKHGKDYYFLSVKDFKNRIKNDEFVEWEEVYADHFYGTLKEEVYRLWEANKVVVFDVDVYGGINLKKFFGDQALSVFVLPPSLEELEKRLRLRSTETEDKIQTRLAKSEEELKLNEQFDIQLVNDKLVDAISAIQQTINSFLTR